MCQALVVKIEIIKITERIWVVGHLKLKVLNKNDVLKHKMVFKGYKIIKWKTYGENIINKFKK